MLDDQVFYVTAGIASATTFRHNLAKRILEAFSNLHWMLQIGAPKQAIEREFRIYETLYVELTKLGVKEIGLCDAVYRQLTAKLGS